MMLEPVLDAALWAAIGRPPHAKPLERLTLRWLDDQAIGALSAGDITGSENDESTFVPVPGGLFDERVFGVIPRLSDGKADVWAMLTQRYKADPTPWDREQGFVSRRRATGWYGRWGRIRFRVPVQHPWVVLHGHRSPLLHAIPVLPPGLRPCLPSSEGGVLDSDINVAYRAVLEAEADALKLQRAIDVLFTNESLPQPALVDGKPLCSLTGLVSPTRRWAALQELDAWTSDNPAVLSEPLPEPHFCTVMLLRAICIEIFVSETKPRVDAQPVVAADQPSGDCGTCEQGCHDHPGGEEKHRSSRVPIIRLDFPSYNPRSLFASAAFLDRSKIRRLLVHGRKPRESKGPSMM